MSKNTDDVATVLDIDNLKKVYQDGTVAVDNISFSISESDFCVIIGPSGCGKSTTLKSILGTIDPTGGTIRLQDQDITDTKTHKRNIGLVFQDYQLFPHLNVIENVRYGLERIELAEPEIQERVSDMLEMVNLREFQNKRVTDLSGGQQQRVALARSLVMQPDLILFDEPLESLDYKMRNRLEKELLNIHSKIDTTFVYVTHDQTQAMRLADKIILMNDGKIEQAGGVKEVYESPSSAFVASFFGEANIFECEIVDAEETEPYCTIKTPLGEMKASSSNLNSSPLSLVDDSIFCSIRPHLINMNANGDNVFSAELLDQTYMPKSGTKSFVRTGDQIEAELQVNSHREMVNTPNTFEVSWDAEDVILVETLSRNPDTKVSDVANREISN